MDGKSDASLKPTPEQVRYAGVLEKGMYVGLACLFVTFALYVVGIMEPYTPVEKLPEYWTLKVGKKAGEYLREANIDPGWWWVGKLGHGDFVNFVGIAFLSGITILCYMAIVPLLVKKKDFIYTILVLLEIVVLAVAASGIIKVAH